MHNAVKHFIKQVRKEMPHKFRFRNILEVGAHNINGSIRKYFWFCKWTGVDISKGKGVDIVGNFTEMNFDRKYSCVVCCEVLEHAKEWKEILQKMYDVLEDGGLFIMTCAAPDRTPHGTSELHPECSPDTNEYYRNVSTEDFKSVLTYHQFDLYVLRYARGMNDLYFYGIKPYIK